MNNLTLPQILEESAKLHAVEIVPAPVGVDIYAKMRSIANQYGLGKHLKGASTELSVDGKRFVLKFDHPITAHTFMMRLNQELESDYNAINPETPIGFEIYDLVKRIS